jgi:hypothetical protein
MDERRFYPDRAGAREPRRSGTAAILAAEPKPFTRKATSGLEWRLDSAEGRRPPPAPAGMRRGSRLEPEPNVLRRLVWVVLAAVLLHGLWQALDHAVLLLRSPWSRDYGEGCVLAMAQLLAKRGDYFPSLHGYPFLVANYPPVFVGLTAAGMGLLGPGLFAPRLLSALATLGLLAVLYPLLRRLSGRRDVAAALTLTFLFPWFVTTWAALGRVDMLALLLSLAGLAVVERHGAGPRAWPALPLFWLAFFTKQTTLTAPAAVLLDLGLSRDRRLPRAFVAWAAPLAILFGALVVATHGQAWRHLIVYTAAAGYEWRRMAQASVELAVLAGPLLLLVACALVLEPRATLAGSGRLFVLHLLLKLLGFATIAKEGAAQNYFIEPWLALLPAAAVALRVLGERRATAHPAFRPAVLLVAAAVAHFAYTSRERLPRAVHHPDRAREEDTLARLVHDARGPVVSENLSVLVANRRPVLVEPFGVLLLVRHGLLRPDVIVRDCEAGRFALVVTETRLREIPGFGNCLDRTYEPVADLGPYQAFEPRPRPPRPD